MLPKEYCDLNFKSTVKSWDEAIPLGSGQIGALIWGDSNKLRFSLDRGDIWDNTKQDIVKHAEYSYNNMVKLAGEGNKKEIDRIFDAPYNKPTPTKLPAGKLQFDFGKGINVESHLSLKNAEATIKIGEIELKSFIHAKEHIGFIKTNQKLLKFEVLRPKFGVTHKCAILNKINNNARLAFSLKALKYPKAEIYDCKEFKGFKQKIGEGFSYGLIVVERLTKDGAELAFRVAYEKDGKDWFERALKKLNDALDVGYDEQIIPHKKWWSDFYHESAISIPNKFFEKNWYLTNYLLGSCSKKGYYPMPLQGVWTADCKTLPPWKGDYHHDLNTQLCYSSYLKANHLGAGEVFLDFLFSLKDVAEKFASSFYNAKGLCLPAVMSIEGESLGGWGMYSLSPTNQIWLCQSFERYYKYSGDKQFLKSVAYPYIKGTAECILSLLKPNKLGKLELPISSSPEIHDNTIKAFLKPNTNYDLSLMKYLFKMLYELCAEIKGEEKDLQKWQETLSLLDELRVDKDNVLMVSKDERMTISHRHFSHAMAIHPLKLLDNQNPKDRNIMLATIKDLYSLGPDNWCGYSYAWLAALNTTVKDGDKAAEALEIFWKYFCSQNGFHLNGDYKKHGYSKMNYRPFTLEGNFCAADALQEMLLYSENGILEIFPSVPLKWLVDGLSFTTLRAEFGLLVSAKVQDNKIIIEFSPNADKLYFLKLNGYTVADKKLQAEADFLKLNLKANKKLIVELIK